MECDYCAYNAYDEETEEYYCSVGSLTLPFKPHNTQILYLSLLWAYFFVKFVKIMRASLH